MQYSKVLDKLQKLIKREISQKELCKILNIKRLHLKLSGELEVISDNPKYEKETFNPNTNVEIAIRGRIIKNLSNKGL